MKKRLYRNKKNGVVFGVCEGIGDYLNIDPVLIRIAWILTLVCYGTGAVAYLLACFLIPNKSE
ncbi:MAG: PspC domain-containing protein [Flavobacteriales bacterium]|jgi:phage shock protein C|nr:PspC domain-containing protein [Flavobacteriales bacterium]|tara:strand:+ start:179 stop:367 length:189 start_codon:yes stop_codon:yes gene_type:complete